MFQIDLLKSAALFSSMQFQFPKPWILVTYWTSKSVLIPCLQTAKLLNSSCRRIGQTILEGLFSKPSDNCCCSLFSETATGGVLLKRCSLKVRKFHRDTSVLQSVCNKLAGLRAYNFVKKKLQHRCFLVKFGKYLRTPILKKQAVNNFFTNKPNSSFSLIITCTRIYSLIKLETKTPVRDYFFK